MRYLLPLLLLSGCSTVNINAPQPNLQSINGGHPSRTSRTPRADLPERPDEPIIRAI